MFEFSITKEVYRSQVLRNFVESCVDGGGIVKSSEIGKIKLIVKLVGSEDVQ